MSKTINTAAYTSSPLESADFDGFEHVADVRPFKALTGPQYRAWAKAVGVQEADAMAFHQITGNAPQFSHGRPIGETHRLPLLTLAAHCRAMEVCAFVTQSGYEPEWSVEDAVAEALSVTRTFFYEMTGHWLS